MYWTFIEYVSDKFQVLGRGDTKLQDAIDDINTLDFKGCSAAVYDEYGKCYYAREL